MASAMKWVRLDHAESQPVSVGDMVSADAGGMPIFQVIRYEAGQVWLGGEHRQTVLVQPIEAFQWKAQVA